MADKKTYREVERFKVISIYTDGIHGNDIDIETKDRQKYQIAVDKGIKLSKDLIGKHIELKYKKVNNRYYFKRINYSIG